MNNFTINHTIYIVDDDESHLYSLKKLLTSHQYSVFGFNSADSFFSHAQISHPCVLLLDMRMPDKNGLYVQRRLLELDMRLPIIFLSGQSYPEEIIQSFKSGIYDFVTKPFDCDALLSVINEAIQFDIGMQASTEARAHAEDAFNTLTDREKEICQLLNEGLRNIEIAEKLNITPRTVKAHKSQIMGKMNSENIHDLMKKWQLIQR